MSSMSVVGINHFRMEDFHGMMFEILNTYSYNTCGVSYNNLEPEDMDMVWNQVRLVFDSRLENNGIEMFSGYKMIEE